MSQVASDQLGFWRRMPQGVRRRVLFLLLADLAIFAFIASRTFGTQSSWREEVSRVLSDVTPIVLAGIGLTGLMCCGAIDLSIGAILGVAGTAFGILAARGFPVSACLAVCFATAVGLSACNGALVRLSGLPAIIVTLAGMAFFRGVALILADLGAQGFSEQFTLPADAYHVLGRDYSRAVLLAGLAAAMAWECLGKTPRTWLALGNSANACRLQGLNSQRILFAAFLVNGVFLGLAALVEVTNRITIEPARLGVGWELTVIAAVVLGGTSIFGGQGSYLGTALGALFLSLIGPAMLYAGVDEYWRKAVQGGAILAVIGVDCALNRQRKLLEELR